MCHSIKFFGMKNYEPFLVEIGNAIEYKNVYFVLKKIYEKNYFSDIDFKQEIKY